MEACIGASRPCLLAWVRSGSLIITFKRAPPREVLITLLASLHFMPDEFSLGCCVRQRGVGRGRGKPAGGSGYSDSNGKTWPRGRLTSLAPSQPPCTYPITREQKCRLQPLCPQCPRCALRGSLSPWEEAAVLLPGSRQFQRKGSQEPRPPKTGVQVRSQGHPKQKCGVESSHHGDLLQIFSFAAFLKCPVSQNFPKFLLNSPF